MSGEWKVTSQMIGDVRMYAAVRIIDTSKVDHSGNREYFGGYKENREEVEATVEHLNKAKEKTADALTPTA